MLSRGVLIGRFHESIKIVIMIHESAVFLQIHPVRSRPAFGTASAALGRLTSNGSQFGFKNLGALSDVAPPLPIPNRVVKRISADGT